MFRRILAAVLTLAIAAALAIIAWPQLLGLEKAPIVAQSVSLRGLGSAIALLSVIGLTLVALLVRPARRLAASIALMLFVFVLVNAAVASSRGFGNVAFETPNSTSLTVLSWNTLGDAPGAEAIAQLALESDADIITLAETTKATGVAVAEIMGAADHPMWAYTVAYDEVSKARSTTLLISAEFGPYTVAPGQTTSLLPSVVATPTDGTGPTIVSVHAVAPLPGELANWRSDLSWLAATCTGSDIIMAGDFNSTIDHFSRLANSPDTTLGDCTDAALLSDNAAVGTWPTVLPALLGAPIDHVMYTRNWRNNGMRVIETHDRYGSDHRPIVARFSQTN